MTPKPASVLDEWRSVIALLDAYGIPASRIQIQPALARNWDYYTGIVFELWSEDGHHLGGGGRYDELTRSDRRRARRSGGRLCLLRRSTAGGAA